jgi:predicted ATPase
MSCERASSVAPPIAPLESGEVLDRLTSLVQKSLVVYEADGQGGGRYRLLEMVRQYSGERLVDAGEAAAMRNRHLACFLALADTPDIMGRARADALEPETDNLRAALEWSKAGNSTAASGMRLINCLWWCWWIRSRIQEARQNLTLFLAREELQGRRSIVRERYALRASSRASKGTWPRREACSKRASPLRGDWAKPGSWAKR